MKFFGLLNITYHLPVFGYLTPVVATGNHHINYNATSNLNITRSCFCLLVFSLIFSPGFSQKTLKETEQDLAYTHVINQRAEKIVTTLSITDAAKSSSVRNIITHQYRSLNDIHTFRDNKIESIKLQTGDKGVIASQVKDLEDKANVAIERLHDAYIESLSKELTSQQIEKVKDGMTYGVVPITYKGYLSMLQNLTGKQKEQILAWLIEAREHAMSAETSDKKHWWFGKYKGKINNYLSAAGYNMKKESEEWHKRLKAEEAAKKSQ